MRLLSQVQQPRPESSDAFFILISSVSQIELLAPSFGSILGILEPRCISLCFYILPSDLVLQERFLVQQCARLVVERTHWMVMWVPASRLCCYMFPVKLMNSRLLHSIVSQMLYLHYSYYDKPDSCSWVSLHRPECSPSFHKLSKTSDISCIPVE